MKKFLFAGMFALFLNGCGGGGGSNYTSPELIVINEQNADAAVVTSLESMGIRSIGDIVLPTNESPVTKIVSYAKTVSLAIPSYAIVTSTDPIVEPCTYDGNYTVSDDNTTFTFYECSMEENVTLDGTVKWVDTTFEFIELTVDDKNSGFLTYFSSAIFSATSSDAFSATISGYATDSVNRVDFERYTVTGAQLTEIGGNFTFNGYVKTDCLGGWIQIKTIQAIPIPANDVCPTQGEISVIGANSEVNVRIGPNSEMITITLNGEPYTVYQSCNDIPSIGDVCPLQPI